MFEDVFPLKALRGISPDVLRRLESVGVVNVVQMLEMGRTPDDRACLARQAGLYHDAGIDSIEKLAAMDPEELRQMLESFVDRSQLDGIAPLPKAARSAVRKAQRLPKIVEY